MKDQLDSFLTRGYAIFDTPGLLDLSKFNITNVELDDNLSDTFTPEERFLLCKFVDHVSKNYVAPIYPEFEVKYYSAWDGVDMGSTCWHNDSVEGFDFNVLYYFDDTSENVGGSIEFMYPGGEDKIYPKHGTLVFINQGSNFLHKASRSKNKRRVASIEYKIYE